MTVQRASRAMRAITMKINESDYLEATDSNQGWCRECKAFTHDSAEPDARNYECPECGKHTVFGAEEALIMGLIEF